MDQQTLSYTHVASPQETEVPVIDYNRSVDELRDLFAASPDQAIGQIVPTAESVRNGRRHSDGTFARPVYDVIGDAYPSMTREQKDRATLEAISIMDHTNDMHIQWHVTSHIRDPQFVVDIALMRRHYYPDSSETKLVAQNHPRFHMIRSELLDDSGRFRPDKIDSDFVVGYGLLRSDFLDCGEDFARVADPQFLGRLMKGIVAWRFGKIARREELSEKEIEEGRKRLKYLLPEFLHDSIESLRIGKDWIDVDKYQQHWQFKA